MSKGVLQSSLRLAGAVRRSCAQRISKVFDQYLAFIALESSVFSLGLPGCYLELNDPAAKDTQIEANFRPHSVLCKESFDLETIGNERNLQ